MNKIIVRVIDKYKKPNPPFIAVMIALLALLSAVVWLIVYHTGGTKYVYLHLNYIPILISAIFFGAKGGSIAAVFAGVMMGPFMPMDVENNVSQPFSAYLIRTFFFLLIGSFVGYMSDVLKIHLGKIQENLDKISVVYANTLKNYARMVSARDEQTAFHCERVAYNSALVGRAIGLEGKKIDALYWAGLLHDVGKIGIKENILLKPGKLTKDEFTAIKEHTVIGSKLISSLAKEFDMVAEGVRFHHERWDGTGYPRGLKGKEIPLSGRIIAVVDVFEALTSERPYKDAWKPEEAMAYLINNKGSHFDPYIVDVFQQLYDEGKIWIYNFPIELEERLKPEKFSKELFI